MLVPRNYGLVVDGYVVQSTVRMEEEEGPPPPAPDGRDWRLLPVLPDWSAPLGGRLRWVDFGVPPEWERPALADQQAAAIARTYADVDAVYDAAIGRRATEYERAEAAARAYLAAGAESAEVSPYIAGHARNNPTGQQQTNAWAAQQIVDRADAFRWAELQMRNARFERQADMRAASTVDDLDVAVGAWDNFITELRVTLGI